MAKKQVAVTLRKPPQADVESYVSASVTSVAPSAASVRALSAVPDGMQVHDETITTSDGRAFREVTVYLPSALARRLSLHCMEGDRDVSRVVAEVLTDRFDAPAVGAFPSVAAKHAPKGLFEASLELGRDVALSLWRIRPWAN
jgi:hypothetical protein